MSVERFRDALRGRINKAGSQRALAAEIAVSQPHISEVLSGADPSDALVEALGWTREAVYRKARPGAVAA